LTDRSSGYFVINQPSAGTQWSNGAVNAISWTKGLLDGIDTFDVELARLGTEGLIFVAREGGFTLILPMHATPADPVCEQCRLRCTTY
jgi:hypothetical protein